MLSIDINYTISQLIQVMPGFWGAFLFALILTPLIAKLAKKIGAIDLPAIDRKRTERGLETRIHTKPLPRLGGLAIVIPFLILMFYLLGFDKFSIGMGISLLILTVVGIIDDRYDLHGGVQLLFQVIAVLVIIFSGTRVLSIDIFGAYMNFERIIIPFSIFNFSTSFIFPADIFTLIWFLGIINAMNWVSGIDALEETMGWIAGLTLMLIAIKFGQNDTLAVISVFTGAVLGFWIFNFPPSKILGGTVSNTVLGFLLTLFAIKIDGKLTTTILLLALPLVDFVWVIVKRIIKYKVINPARLMTISGRHHLHHRLMELGYSDKQILLIEMSIFSMFAVAAYYFAGFNKTAVAGLMGIVALLFFFAFLTVVRQTRKKKKEEMLKTKGELKKGEIREAPEKVYAY